jgi:predicted metal-binding protein
MSNVSENFQQRKTIAKERMLVCFECEKYIKATTQCKECGCVMLLKTLLMDSSCPLNKWGAENFDKDN